MKGGDDGHPQLAQQCQDVSADRSPENTELMLQADNVNVADIQKVGGAQIRRQVLLLNFEANHLRVVVSSGDVVHGHAEALALRMRSRNRGQQVRRERGNAALAGQVIADERDLVNFRRFSHKESATTLSARTTYLRGAEPTK